MASKPARPAKAAADEAAVESTARGVRPRRSATWRPLKQRSALHVLTLCAIFAGVIGAGAYAARDPQGLLQSMGLAKGPGTAQAGRPDRLTGSSSMAADDPVRQFEKTGVGHVLFTGADTGTCKRTLFDNKTGSYRTVSDVTCALTPEQVAEAKSSERLQSIRKGFNK